MYMADAGFHKSRSWPTLLNLQEACVAGLLLCGLVA